MLIGNWNFGIIISLILSDNHIMVKQESLTVMQNAFLSS